MPRGDGTGPMGTGSMTGRGVGYCAGNTAPGFASAGYGAGWGGRCRGFAGGGYGRRNMFYATGQPGWVRFGGVNASLADPEVEQAALKGRAEALGTELERIKARLEALESKKPQD
ncbi:DUF5320 domain-containing protein [Trichloromonas acetexigens]|uniref:DUF5320 domain-containing protein n=1 Tax=Trichloromonas acetexigens TaxID=38815 RepID=A0A550JFC8_9BACT|nr:DUF5320 domain-containing protein [Desulfuromonas acetexigens]TRO81895.1 hypothetical protein FL622_08845 [Desulfuromonas acetexigens]